jgi:hypothetical protein
MGVIVVYANLVEVKEEKDCPKESYQESQKEDYFEYETAAEAATAASERNGSEPVKRRRKRRRKRKKRILRKASMFYIQIISSLTQNYRSSTTIDDGTTSDLCYHCFGGTGLATNTTNTTFIKLAFKNNNTY